MPSPGHPSRSKGHRPRATSSHPHDAQRQPARVCALGLVTGPHSTLLAAEEPRAACPSHLPPGTDGLGRESAQPRTPLNTTREREGRREDRAARPSSTNDRQSKGPGQETQKGTYRLEPPYQRPARGPREERASKGNRRGGKATTAGARAHKHNRHAARTKGATRPSTRNAQTAWNGVPADEDKGHPGGAARQKQHQGREGGRARGGAGRQEVAPAPSS